MTKELLHARCHNVNYHLYADSDIKGTDRSSSSNNNQLNLNENNFIVVFSSKQNTKKTENS